MRPDHDAEKIIRLLDNAQYCGLKEDCIPGKHFLIDLIYENMEKEFSVKFDYLSDFCKETNINMYDYNFCKFVVNHWKCFALYGLFINNVNMKKKQIAKIVTTYNEL